MILLLVSQSRYRMRSINVERAGKNSLICFLPKWSALLFTSKVAFLLPQVRGLNTDEWKKMEQLELRYDHTR